MAVRMEWNDPAIDGWTGVPGQWLENKGDELVIMAKSSVGVDSGALQANITKNKLPAVGGTLDLEVGANPGGDIDGYAKMHHNGTDPHVIKPKKKGGMLRFVSNGKVVYAKIVHHPGTPPNPYLTRWLKILFG